VLGVAVLNFLLRRLYAGADVHSHDRGADAAAYINLIDSEILVAATLQQIGGREAPLGEEASRPSSRSRALKPTVRRDANTV
jgi:hypothetical protein